MGMDASNLKRTHVVAMPFPGRGHINPMMNFCKLLTSRQPNNLLITFVVTEEWLGYIGSDPKPSNVRFATIPNVLPTERLKAVDFPGFYEAVMTKMEAPFEQLLDGLEPSVNVIIGDIELRWPIGLGNRRNIPVAAFWTMSATFLTMLYHYGIFLSDRHLPVDFLGHDDQTTQIPGISSMHLVDLKTVIHETDKRVMELALECILEVRKTQCLVFTSVQELEDQEFNSLKVLFPFPVYSIGPCIPYLELDEKIPKLLTGDDRLCHLQWLDSQPVGSVLYISLGSFLSVSPAQMDEILVALNSVGIRFFWIARGEATRLKEKCGERGLIVPWCDQLKVLSHCSIGGFWSHCGWNSTLEAVFAGVPMLTFPLFLDQVPNSRQIVQEWKNGVELKRDKGSKQILLGKKEISERVKGFMEAQTTQGKKMRENARGLRNMCQRAIAEGGSSYRNLDSLITSFSEGNCQFNV
uniref:UDP-glucosyltransferase UGT87H5 n=1 Tax=Polygala tenuifolia TaxID=355332 RepID=A0A3G3NBU9_9FABA|nr:UDP-glucosyltransferase UGT87H5 [Polygala tenuifolia]